MLVKKACRRDDVARVYLAIQAALAFGRESVDVGALLGALMPDGQRAADASGEAIGAEGLAYFFWLYEIELVSAGEADCHNYRFRRRADGAQVTAFLRTAPQPKSLQYQQRYERQRRSLETKRTEFLKVARF